MKSPRAIALIALLTAATSQAAKVDMSDPRRAVGREDDVRVDAELAHDTVSSRSKIGVIYQVQNLTASPIAIADKVSDTTYDAETQTITISLGAEVPAGETMPHLVVIAPGETKTFRSGGSVSIAVPNQRGPWTPVPRFVQIKVTVLRDLKPFAALIDQQNKMAAAPPLSNDSFDQWVDRVASVFLNPIPVRWEAKSRNDTGMDAEQAAPGGF